MTQAVAKKVVLSYDMTLADMLKECEAVGKIDPYITEVMTEEHFPITGAGEVAMPTLEGMGPQRGVVGPDRLRSILEERGLRPATLAEMLMFMVNNPEEATAYAIAALSPAHITPVGRFKVWHGGCPRRFVPTIINRARFHNGGWLERPGTPEIWLTPESHDWSRCGVNWHFAVLPV